MSFSSDCKEELCRVPCDKSCCRMAELTALYLCLGSFSILGQGRLSVRFAVESAAIARRIYRFVQAETQIAAQLQYITHARFGGTREYVLTIGPNEAPALLERLGMMSGGPAPMLLSTIPSVRLTKACCRHAFLRGAILGCGTLVNPENAYHLEFLVKDEKLRKSILRCLKSLDIPAKQTARKNGQSLYVKQSEHILTILTATGAHQAVTTLESTLVKRQVLGNVNRAINCDYANLQKQMNAGAEQLRLIEILLDSDDFASLPPGLQEIARARAQAPDLSLTELGQRMDPPISKSGVNNRMRRLMQIARETANNLETTIRRD
ncbi:MAG TPA: DNA-binding protein WhiA [Candidatus Limiplasma sp.]|nr:DNA-binding protein WhiA [Candidatus Limiplasma sp.]HRX08407.1 DNA-binding protein WhiA [Candidatus Limiplasma sp.]